DGRHQRRCADEGGLTPRKQEDVAAASVHEALLYHSSTPAPDAHSRYDRRQVTTRPSGDRPSGIGRRRPSPMTGDGRAVDGGGVGAGPAGATAALVLARAGVDVMLLDRAALPRDKTCGGGVVARALATLPPGVDIPVERRLGRVESRFVGAGVSVTV